MPRTPAEVIASFFKEKNRPKKTPKKASKPHTKHIGATLDGKDVALARLSLQVALREGAHILRRVALCDGCEALQSRLVLQFPGFILILDFVPANEYLWDAANSLLGETSEQRLEWVKSRTLQILSGQTAQVIAELRLIAKNKKNESGAKNTTQQNSPLLRAQLALYGLPNLSVQWLSHRIRRDRRRLSALC
jgi:hypothetical protein